MYGHLAESTRKLPGVNFAAYDAISMTNRLAAGHRREGMELPLAADANGCARLNTF